MTTQIDYSNPEKKPLNELSFHVKDNGVRLTIPALDKHWVQSKPHPKYLPLPTDSFKLSDVNVIDEWLSEAEWFNKEMEWFLGLQHHRFWSNLLYEPGCMSSIISFLQEATPSYIPVETLTSDGRVITLYFQILKNVLSVLCRMITNKESDTEWTTVKHLSELLYEKFLISIPMIFDVFVVYGRSNEAIIKRFVQTILKIEPKYENDLNEGLQYLVSTFDVIQKKIEENENSTSFEDLALYTLDCAFTIHTLLIIHPAAHEICSKLKLEQRVTNFYDNSVQMLYKNIRLINPDSKGLKYLNHARIELLGFFRCFVNKFIAMVLSERQPLLPAENLLATLQEALSDHNFVIDYQRLYPIQNDVDILKQACRELDLFKVNFIVEAYTAENEEFLKTFVDNMNLAESATDQSSAANKSSPDNPMQKEIQNVLDVLPHLDRDFVQKLLSRYESTELAITAVLEGNLPPDLDVNNPLTPPTEEPSITVHEVADLVNEMDFNIEPNTKILVKSDKNKVVRRKAEKRILDDKTHVQELRSRYTELGYISEDYEDEYDDSYDALAESETKSVAKLFKNSGTLNNVLADIDDVDDESSDDDDGDEGRSARDATRDFCENPEAVRERWAQARNNRPSKFPNRPSGGDVVGKPKGQGQEKSTVNSRHKKDVHKSTRANHNRRQGAAFKRNRGMIPS